ncbi:hypothetical protein [Actinomadura mexicana]|uniref:Uncharacterized protein n=1 Tax=Actinomadura mexicana TaxID=134959 RepID=A0A239DB42_9ACTN|nr:hypothetical protein [Actinomadura mexicana]SNS28913.1 hypothetical protein SAMN06265355_11455 [Actinomadura mexicana]
MNEERETPPPWSTAITAECPVGGAQQAWIETSITWFVREFGRDPAMRPIVLPWPDLRSAGYTGTPEQINDVVTRTCELMEVDRSELIVELFGREDEDAAAREGKRTVGHYYVENGRAVIGLDMTEASDAAYLTAVIAHELCHVRLLGEERITHGRKDHERLTDLLTVYFGFGVFSTNAAVRFDESTRGFSVQPLGDLDERTLNAARHDGYTRLGYLTEREFAYAMACYAWLRGETEPPWASHLDPGPRTLLRQGLAYLARAAAAGGFPTNRTGSLPVSVRVVPKADRVWLGGLYLMVDRTEWPPNAPRHRPS